MQPIRHLTSGLWLLTALLLISSCAKKETAAPPPHDQPPHGGTAVEFANGIYHLELVLDADTGKLTAYVLDGELEEYVRAGAPSFEIMAKVGGRDETLLFQPVATPATGETLAATSQYEAQADWLKTAKAFDAVLKSITVRGSAYTDVKFNFPKGNDSDG